MWDETHPFIRPRLWGNLVCVSQRPWLDKEHDEESSGRQDTIGGDQSGWCLSTTTQGPLDKIRRHGQQAWVCTASEVLARTHDSNPAACQPSAATSYSRRHRQQKRFGYIIEGMYVYIPYTRRLGLASSVVVLLDNALERRCD